jgi:hypothetical protein
VIVSIQVIEDPGLLSNRNILYLPLRNTVSGPLFPELSELEYRIKHKIAQTKTKMHETQERTDRLWPEIDIELGIK